MNEIECIFCQIKSDRVAIEENGYQGKRCPECGLIYISPRPSLDEIVDLYGHNEAHIPAKVHIAASFAKRLHAKHNLSIVSSVVKSGALLEIGAGAGYFLDEARAIGYEPHGLEFNPVQADFVRNQLQIPCEESTLDRSMFSHQKFDLVYHCDVISHFFDPIAEFKKMHEVMADESFLVFETGNFAEVDPKYYKYISRFQYPDHLFFFSIDNLRQLLERTGFELVEKHHFSLSPQLVTLTTLSKIKSRIKKILSSTSTVTSQTSSAKSQSAADNLDQSDSHSQGNSQNKFGFKQRAKQLYKYIYQYTNYCLRYKLGRIAPKANRPQTVVVVAKKKPLSA